LRRIHEAEDVFFHKFVLIDPRCDSAGLFYSPSKSLTSISPVIPKASYPLYKKYIVVLQQLSILKDIKVSNEKMEY